MNKLNLNKLIKLNFHLGHLQNTNLISPYLLGRRKKRYIFDIEKSLVLLRRCLFLIDQIHSKKGEIWWLGTNTTSKKVLSDLNFRKKSNSKIFKNAWNPGLITNQAVFKDISNRFISNNSCLLKRNDIFHLNSKTFQSLDLSIFRQRKKGDRFKDFLNYVFQSKGNIKLPDLLVILNPKENYTALIEAQKMNIPTIIFIDSDYRIRLNNISYVIPINDDNLEAISFCCSLFLESIDKKELNENKL